MPRLLRERLGDDTILKLEAAAKARRQTAVHLHKTGFRLEAVYFYGYAIEETVKAAYFRTVGFSEDGRIEDGNRRTAVDEYRALGLLVRPGQHDIQGWAELLVAKRASLSRPYGLSLATQIVIEAGVVRPRWSEIIRYRTNIPYHHELQKIAEAALWFEQKYPAMI